ncbi:xanthine dehydrogenase family protein subunit M [Fulvimarina sp. MAC3]|uniref:FAD binding domain-containing protein n=1 Tax=Fulvimarina sp. MAC3 TaxID=3148887 RepID=UPI0031FCD2DA
MKRFDYVRPETVSEAIEALAAQNAAVLAGGTNLLDLMKGNVARPDRIVDLTRVSGLDAIEALDDGGMRIGALVKNSNLAYDETFAARYPMVAEGLLSGASAQLRNAASVGGNLLQKPRCRYFLDPASACNRRSPGSGCDAIGGDTEGMAILGWTESCIAVHPSDFCVPLAALGAIVEVEGPDGSRELPLGDLHRLPGNTPDQETTLRARDIITAIRLPADAARFADHSRYLKLRDRTSYAFAIVSAAAALELDGERIVEARLALGGVAAKPWRCEAAEDALKGRPATRESFETAAKAALQEAKPVGENGFKIDLAARILVRALLRAKAGTPAQMPALPASVFEPVEGEFDHV